ncbi:MAG: DUF6377 domain-containing protein [Bacteroidales bacterium]|nr:DUF6377 domain-containing protein [Bacteroidales bacterium]
MHRYNSILQGLCMSMLLAILLLFTSCYRTGGDEEALLNVLDKDIVHKKVFQQQRQMTIDSLKMVRKRALSDEDIYQATLQLTDEYLNFMCDSALSYALQNEQLAIAMNDTVRMQEMQIRLLNVCSMAGLFMDIPDRIYLHCTDECVSEQVFPFCWAMVGMYEHLVIYNKGNPAKEREYAAKRLAYRDTLAQMLPEGSGLRKKEEVFILQAKGRPEDALELLMPLIADEQPGTRVYGLNSMTLASLYHDMGDTQSELRHLAISADMDIRYGVRENEALLALAKLMYDQGNHKRAYLYATNAIEDAEQFNSRHRFTQITGFYQMIKNTYLEEQRRGQNLQRIFMWGFAALALLLVAGLLLLWRNHRKLDATRSRLHATVEDLADANARLGEAGKIREYFIAYLIAVNSTYATKLEEYRKMVYRKLKARQYDDLQHQSSRPLGDDLEEVFEQFDRTFLSLYPTFVEEFNALLTPEHRYSTLNRNLCTEQRIFALYRFGMTDMSQIANFLHYSTQTIYNYKYKVKSHALDKEHFEENVMHIGA